MTFGRFGATGSEPFPGQIKFTFWHVTAFAWFCNAAMHLGMSDLSVLRYADRNSVGWTSAAGMYVGHYMAWISACLMFALYLKSPEAEAILAGGGVPPVAPGPLAYEVVGIAGLVCVLGRWLDDSQSHDLSGWPGFSGHFSKKLHDQSYFGNRCNCDDCRLVPSLCDEVAGLCGSVWFYLGADWGGDIL
jgi:hypothetical protein